jgi:hypothetical protein
MGRSVAVALAALLISVAPAQASERTAWARVLRAHDITRTSHKITVRPGHVVSGRISVRVHVRSTVAHSVFFPDQLYGATAWRWTGSHWRRIDSALVRPALAQELAPGQTARVRLPLERRPARIRVLVPVTADQSGAWTDVVR